MQGDLDFESHEWCPGIFYTRIRIGLFHTHAHTHTDTHTYIHRVPADSAVVRCGFAARAAICDRTNISISLVSNNDKSTGAVTGQSGALRNNLVNKSSLGNKGILRLTRESGTQNVTGLGFLCITFTEWEMKFQKNVIGCEMLLKRIIFQ